MSILSNWVLFVDLAALCYLIGVLNGFMDDLQFNPESWLAKYHFFSPGISALNKWKIATIVSLPTLYTRVLIEGKYYYKVNNNTRLWYYLWLYKPEFKERFWYSSTFLVFLTQGWHLFKFFMFLLMGIVITYILCYAKLLPTNWYSYTITPTAIALFRCFGFVSVSRIAVK